MRHKRNAHNRLRFCDASRQPIVCVKCLRLPKLPNRRKGKRFLCEYHKALLEYRTTDGIDDSRPFDVTTFIQKIDWTKVLTSCQPELTMLFKGFRRANEEIARRVV